MTDTLYETIRRIVTEELGQLRSAELGLVQELHPHASDGDSDNYACTVRLRNSGIVLRRIPVATQQIGVVSIPAEGELVLVQFIDGDINAPVITGRLYNEEDRPPVNDGGQAVLHLPLAAADDEAVHAELHSGERREIVLKIGGALALRLRDDDPVVEINVGDGKGTIGIARDGAIDIQSSGAISIGGGEITIDGDAITIEASGELTLKGATVNLN